MRRRRAIAALGAALTGGIAGCSGGDSGQETATETATATATATETATATATATETATATGTPTRVTHEVDESFTVGEGDGPLDYTVEQLYRAQELGPTRTEQASDTFLLVILSVGNPNSRTVDVPTPKIKLRASGVIRNVDDGASQAAGSDDRLDVDSIASATVPANESVTGVIVYDAPTGNDYRLEIAPVDEGATHVVSVGEIADIDELAGGY